MPNKFSWSLTDIIWPLLAVVAAGLSRDSDIDWLVSRHYFDPLSQGFPARDAWAWRVLGHHMLKDLGVLLWLALAVMVWRAWRRRDAEVAVPGLFVLLTSLAAVMVNGWLKTHSSHSCPWSLQGLGGTADYFRMLAPLPAHPGSGGCLPSGHAGMGFMWLALIPAARRWCPHRQVPAALGSIAFGLLCGYVQIVRGAHFPSHVVMAAAVCGSIAVLSQHLPIWCWLERRLAAARTTQPALRLPLAS